MKYILMNLAREHEDHAECMPSRELRTTLKTGDYAKLVFITDEAKTEAMWVQVTLVYSDGRYVGTLQNDPRLVHGLKLGDEVAFKAKHINNIGKDQPFEGAVQEQGEESFLSAALSKLFGGARVEVVMMNAHDEDGEEAPADKSKLH